MPIAAIIKLLVVFFNFTTNTLELYQIISISAKSVVIKCRVKIFYNIKCISTFTNY